MVKINFDEAPPAPAQEQEDSAPTVRLTEEAARRIAWILEKEKKQDHFLRITVSGGGCSGFSYSFKLDTTPQNSDIRLSNEAIPKIEVAIDSESYQYLKGSTIDFEETLEASQFVIKNPNAKTSCGCGNSFSV